MTQLSYARGPKPKPTDGIGMRFPQSVRFILIKLELTCGRRSIRPGVFRGSFEEKNGIHRPVNIRPSSILSTASLYAGDCTSGIGVHQPPPLLGGVSPKIAAGRYCFGYRQVEACAVAQCSWATTVHAPAARFRVMKNDKLKATTVRFTDSDLHLIVCLQEKLGLGMIHIIRLAIRRLAESENLLSSSTIVKRR